MNKNIFICLNIPKLESPKMYACPMITQVILITRIPLIERIAPLGASVERIALVFLSMDNAINASCNLPDSKKIFQKNLILFLSAKI